MASLFSERLPLGPGGIGLRRGPGTAHARAGAGLGFALLLSSPISTLWWDTWAHRVPCMWRHSSAQVGVLLRTWACLHVGVGVREPKPSCDSPPHPPPAPGCQPALAAPGEERRLHGPA